MESPVSLILLESFDNMKDGTVIMDERFKRPDVYFEEEGTRLFPNGTILYANGTEAQGLVIWGAMDPW
jgi:hypothetical protein